MKKLLLILLPIFMVMSCDLAQEEDASLYGTWGTTQSFFGMNIETTIVITETTFETSNVYTSVEAPGVILNTEKSKGTFTVDGNSFTQVTTHETDENGDYVDVTSYYGYDAADYTYTGTYSISGNKMTITGTDEDGQTVSVTLTKK